MPGPTAVVNDALNVNVLSDNEEKVAEKPTTKRKPRKTFSIDFSASLPAGAFANVKVSLYVIHLYQLIVLTRSQAEN